MTCVFIMIYMIQVSPRAKPIIYLIYMCTCVYLYPSVYRLLLGQTSWQCLPCGFSSSGTVIIRRYRQKILEKDKIGEETGESRASLKLSTFGVCVQLRPARI